jgi:hypothetical protein
MKRLMKDLFAGGATPPGDGAIGPGWWGVSSLISNRVNATKPKKTINLTLFVNFMVDFF